MATLPGHRGSFKNHQNAFLNDPIMGYLVILSILDGLILDFGWFDWPDIACNERRKCKIKQSFSSFKKVFDCILGFSSSDVEPAVYSSPLQWSHRPKK